MTSTTNHSSDTSKKAEAVKAQSNSAVSTVTSNTSSVPAPAAKPEDETIGKDGKKKTARTFTYVGGGEESPRRINFMGKQKFVRGEATDVYDDEVIAKLVDNPSFREGEVDKDFIDALEEEASAEADLQRAKDAKVNAKFYSKHNKPGKGD